MMHLMTSLIEMRMICTITGMGKAKSPAESSHPDSSKPVTKDRNNGVTMGDHERQKPRKYDTQYGGINNMKKKAELLNMQCGE